MRLANIVPTSLIPYLPLDQTTHLVLSNIFWSDETYRNFYLQLRKGTNETFILDNPVHEQQPINEDEWLRAAEELRPQFSTLPDMIADPYTTVLEAESAVKKLKAVSPETVPMAVVHGIVDDDAEHEFIKCAEELMRISTISDANWLGVSIPILGDNEYEVQRRKTRISRLYHRYPGINVHLLGLTEDAVELDDDTYRLVRSVDASKFAVRYLTGSPVKPPPLTNPGPKYPGRSALGGSIGYFSYKPSDTTAKHEFTTNLAQWCRYAQYNLLTA